MGVVQGRGSWVYEKKGSKTRERSCWRASQLINTGGRTVGVPRSDKLGPCGQSVRYLNLALEVSSGRGGLARTLP